MSRNDMVIFVFQTTNYADGVFFHGYRAEPQDVAIIAPDCHFTIVTKVRVGWAALAIPIDLFAGYLPRQCHVITSQNSVVSLHPKEFNELIAIARSAPAAAPELAQVTAADVQVLKTLTGLLEKDRPKRLIPDEETLVIENLMREALEFVRLRPDEKITIEDLARKLKVNERTLLRGFRQYLKIGVKQYLLMRQLNLVRRAIRENCADLPQVTAIMADYGVTEFGRFAVRYKELFGETPSETLKNSRPEQSSEKRSADQRVRPGMGP